MSDPTEKISREELHRRVWAQPFVKLAKELGYSYPELVDICAALNIPRPSGGYWYRLAHGGAEEVTPLPPVAPGTPKEIRFGPRLNEEQPTPTDATAPDEPTMALAAPGESPNPDQPNAVSEPKKAKVVAAEVSKPIPSKGQESARKPKAEADASSQLESPKEVEFTREQLFEAVWSKSAVKLAAELGLSDVGLAKTCRRMGIPRPPRGYWARLEAGQKLRPPQLPPAQKGQSLSITFHVAANLARREELATNTAPSAMGGVRCKTVELHPTGTELHPIAERHRLALEKAKPREMGFVSAKGKNLFSCEMSASMVPRFVLALDALLCELEDRDYIFEPGSNEYQGLQIKRDNDDVTLHWSEPILEMDREPTREEKRKPSWTWQLKERKPAGELSVEIAAIGLRGKRKWTSGEGRTLEEILGVVVEKVEAIFRGFETKHLREAEWEKQRAEAARRREEEEAREAVRQAEEEKKRKQQERVERHEAKLETIAEARRENLKLAAQGWIEAQGMLAFVDVCEARWRAAGGELTAAQSEWLAWARSVAENSLPFAQGYPDPASDGKLDASTVPVGGPYPQTREFTPPEEDEQPPPKPQASPPPATYAPPEQFPFWLLHQNRRY